jgi:hypothetical protein
MQLTKGRKGRWRDWRTCLAMDENLRRRMHYGIDGDGWWWQRRLNRRPPLAWASDSFESAVGRLRSVWRGKHGGFRRVQRAESSWRQRGGIGRKKIPRHNSQQDAAGAWGNLLMYCAPPLTVAPSSSVAALQAELAWPGAAAPRGGCRPQWIEHRRSLQVELVPAWCRNLPRGVSPWWLQHHCSASRRGDKVGMGTWVGEGCTPAWTGGFYIYTIITVALYTNIIFIMRLTDVTAFSWISYIFTTLSYVAWHVSLGCSNTVSSCTGNYLPALFFQCTHE